VGLQTDGSAAGVGNCRLQPGQRGIWSQL